MTGLRCGSARRIVRLTVLVQAATNLRTSPQHSAAASFEGTSACLPFQGVGEEVEKEPIEDYVRRDRDREVEVLLVATYEALVQTPSRLNGT